jgi:hypothetical protein
LTNLVTENEFWKSEAKLSILNFERRGMWVGSAWWVTCGSDVREENEYRCKRPEIAAEMAL